jgi:hypothetical protein
MPWHLEELGLPAHADMVAVRRAYAQRLKAIDPAADPAAFERLRAAYEAARAWCAQHEAADTDASSLLEPATSMEPGAPGESPPVPTPDQAAAHAIGQLRAGLPRAVGDEGVRDLLQLIVGTLRFGYVDAPGQFEDMLVDSLRDACIERRAALFDAAATVFHWDEVGRLRGGDLGARWVGHVLTQRETWDGLDATWRMTWFALMALAKERIDGDVAKRWPDMARLRTMLPDWITLHLSAAQLAAWETAFDGLPPRERDKAMERAAPATAMQPSTRPARGRPVWRRVLGVAWLLGVLVSCVYNTSPRGSHDDGEPLPRFGLAAPTVEECHALYARLDGPGPFDGVAKDEVVQIKRRAQRCALDGHWQAPAH